MSGDILTGRPVGMTADDSKGGLSLDDMWRELLGCFEMEEEDDVELWPSNGVLRMFATWLHDRNPSQNSQNRLNEITGLLATDNEKGARLAGEQEAWNKLKDWFYRLDDLIFVDSPIADGKAQLPEGASVHADAYQEVAPTTQEIIATVSGSTRASLRFAERAAEAGAPVQATSAIRWIKLGRIKNDNIRALVKLVRERMWKLSEREVFSRRVNSNSKCNNPI